MRFPSYYFILAYIGSVFLFAGIYTTMPYEFYHSTVKYERGLNNDIRDIRQNLEFVLKDVLRKAHLSDTVKVGDNKFEINSLGIGNIEFTESHFNEPHAKFMFYGSFSAKHASGLHGDLLTLTFRTGNAETKDDGQIQYVESICSADTSKSNSWYFTMYDIFNLKNIKPGKGRMASTGEANCPECLDCGATILPDSLTNKLIAYSDALNGFPSYSSGNFERMFYLSAVTITTVGYGDIVPITPKARLLISIEAIWGIILIGLFLNSLANRVFRNKKDGRSG